MKHFVRTLLQKSLLALVAGLALIFIITGLLFINLNSKYNSVPSAEVPYGPETPQVVNSAYPRDAEFSPMPPLGADPFALIPENDAGLGQKWFDNLRNDPESAGIRTTIYPLPEMRAISGSLEILPGIWLEESKPFEGMWLLEPYIPKSRGQDEKLVLKALLDEREIDFSVDNSEMSPTFLLQQARGERKLFRIKTANLPTGIHTLRFILFRDIDNTSTTPLSFRAYLGRITSGQSFRVFVKGRTEQEKITYFDWSVSHSIFPNLRNIFDLNDGALGEGFPAWIPAPFKPSQQVEYTWMINNPEAKDREYCLIAFLDYKQIPFEQNQFKKCGIVKGGYQARFKNSFQAPAEPGPHYYQLVRIENPEVKQNYSKSVIIERAYGVASSSRILINVAN